MLSSKKLLLVDDDSDALLSLSRALKAYLSDIEICITGTAKKCSDLLNQNKFQVAVVDLELVKGDGPSGGLDLIKEILSKDVNTQVIILTGHSGLEFGIESVKRGATSFIEKPADISNLSVLIQNGFNNYFLKSELQKKDYTDSNINLEKLVGQSDTIKKLKDEIHFAASTNQAVFLCGESGTGKGLCASLIHSLSQRKENKYLRYQPSFLSSDLVNSDLFGHKKGAFTGADKDRDGLLVDCNKGTLFLDEVDTLPIETQVMLLGVLQEKIFRQLGSNTELQTDFRLIAASNASVNDAIKENKLRKDFYFRIANQTILIPPLRERLQDIPLLVESILTEGRTKKDFSVYQCSKSAEVKLKNHNWPGNVRELYAVVEGAAYRAQFANRFEILEEDILIGGLNNLTDNFTSLEEGFHSKVLNFKKHLIREALARSGGNQVQAAKELGIDRSSMRRIILDEL